MAAKPGAWCAFKIERTSGFAGCPIAREDVPNELMSLQTLGARDSLQVFPDAQPRPDGHWQFPRISVGWEAVGHGYVVQCYESAESRSFLLVTSAQFSAPEVYVELGGMAEELWPAQLFTTYELVQVALEYFLETGLQDPALSWVGLNAFPRRTVPRPLRGRRETWVAK